jgi:putative membrane protein
MKEPANEVVRNARDEGQGKPQATEPAASPRDYLANERTLLAWLRTGVALIGLGFVVARFGLFLRELGFRAGALGPGAIGEHWSTLVGTAIILLAALMLGLSYLRYRGAARAMERGTYYHNRGLSLVAALSVLLIALLLAAYLLLTS